MLERLNNCAVLAFLLVIFASAGESAGAQTKLPEPAPQGITACDFVAESRDASEQGLAVRVAPGATAPVLGYIPKTGDKPEGTDGGTKRGKRFRVLGAKDGWLQIEGANYNKLLSPSSPGERGWVDGRSVTVRLYRETLKATPNNAATDVVYLLAYNADGILTSSPASVPVSSVFGCSGRWLEVEIQLPEAKTLTGEPVSANGTVRGWTDRTCVDPDASGQCAQQPFDYPWSPLPSGITECNFDAFSKDHDPAGLNVRAEPDAKARVLGRLPPSINLNGYSSFGVTVIGYKKGWLLVEQGFDAVPDPRLTTQPRYFGRGWVAANLMTTQLLRGKLKQLPNPASSDVIDLKDVRGEGPDDSWFVTPRHVLSCSGDWLHVEIGLSPLVKAPARTDGPTGAVRGWANGTCASQTTPCVADQGAPWPSSPPAPLPPE